MRISCMKKRIWKNLSSSNHSTSLMCRGQQMQFQIRAFRCIYRWFSHPWMIYRSNKKLYIDETNVWVSWILGFSTSEGNTCSLDIFLSKGVSWWNIIFFCGWSRTIGWKWSETFSLLFRIEWFCRYIEHVSSDREHPGTNVCSLRPKHFFQITSFRVESDVQGFIIWFKVWIVF